MTTPTYAQAVGERLRNVRIQKALSLHDVELTSQEEFKASVLGAYERGERAISVPRLQRLARFYGVTVDQLLPDDGPATLVDLRTDETGPTRAGPTGDGRVTVDLRRLGMLSAVEREMLGRYLGMI